jgi:Ca2+-binding RTX toxin-like protein
MIVPRSPVSRLLLGLATTVLIVLPALPTVAHESVTGQVGYHERPEVFCNPYTRQLWIDSYQAKITNNRQESLARQVWTWNLDTGGWQYYPWQTNTVPAGLPGPLNYSVTYNNIAPALYLVGVKYAWNWGNGWTYDFTYGNYSLLSISGAPTRVCYQRLELASVDGGAGFDLCVFGCRHSGRRLSHLARIVPSSLNSVAESTPPPRVRATCFGDAPTLLGTDGDDTLVGTVDDDVIIGLAGSDVILGGTGNDRICAGTGSDGIAGEAGADRLAGNGGGDAILAGEGDDLSLGGPGFDIVEPGLGSDSSDGGGQALDILSYLFSDDSIEVNFALGSASGNGSDRFHGFNAVVGSSQDDVLLGARGNEIFVPQAGDDEVLGGPGTDAIYYLLAPRGVRLDLEKGRSVGEGRDGPLEGLEIASGSAFADVMHGALDFSALYGLAGNDHLKAAGSSDTLDGGDGNDHCLKGLIYLGCENQTDSLILPPPSEPP